ncbi:Get3/ArsA fold putative tail anchor-mediating ATPase NosAFP [Lyngbya confervoides]|uniref:ArsA family ATPase n=1 Tax=Lyngbya confervoides BDU141951 TaxID=1574623 RepID=A0ABD4T1R5_9CYAN|nr:ArsA family ATPase [Lyngbya confervoides]MCM1982433.1 ArsA family ATPase [Lyngbya confervoides BDU141951]
MAFILSFLGKGGTGRTTVALAAARSMAHQGKRVLLASQDLGLALRSQLGLEAMGMDPQPIEPHLDGVQLQAASLLSQSWEEAKALEAQYLRTPFLTSVFGQELGILPGMGDALILYWLKNMDASDRYDAIVFDGSDSQATLRMFGIPEVGGWYARRFKKVFDESDFARTVMPLLQPIAATVLSSADLFGNNFSQPMNQVDGILEQGQRAIADPTRVSAYLVTTADPVAQQTAQWLWGGAQQVNLTVGGVILMPSREDHALGSGFSPLPIHPMPQIQAANDAALVAALPHFAEEVKAAPRPLIIDEVQRQVKAFLPGFTKAQVKLTQYGPELTIEAGDQRRNIDLPPTLRGKRVKGAKFQDSYLIISL